MCESARYELGGTKIATDMVGRIQYATGAQGGEVAH